MKRTIYIIICLFGVFMLDSCGKSEWKEPTEVSFFIDINRTEIMDGRLSFTGGQVMLRETSFDGYRIQADDVYFEREFENGIVVPFSSSNSLSALMFDIPQGTYSSIRIDLSAERSDTETNYVEGDFTLNSGGQIPIFIEVDEIEFYDVLAQALSGDNEINLIAGNPSSAVIILNTVHWMSSISVNMLDNAETTMIDGVESILINSDTNSDVYELIAEKIETNNQVIFN
jgi:hypothetical protein